MKKHLVQLLCLFLVYHGYSQDKTHSFSIHFASGSYAIDEHHQVVLSRILSHVKSNKIDTVYLSGHTDPKGDINYNLTLSKNRVNAVQSYFKDHGTTAFIQANYYGEINLLVKDENSIADSLNRRVEVKYKQAHFRQTQSQHDPLPFLHDKASIIYEFDPNTQLDTIDLNSMLNEVCRNSIGLKNHVIVMDWTRSMYGFGLAMLDWYKNNKHKANFTDIVLFNDGNNLKTHEKFIGQTGGLYSEKIDSTKNIIKLMEYVALQGTGGDYPENIIEALLYAQNTFENADTIVFLADNIACIRDYRLIHDLQKPVKIIVNQINPYNNLINYQFFEIAAATKGMVVCNDQQFTNISFKEGKGPNPILAKDTLIVLEKQKGVGLKKAEQEHNKLMRKLQVYDTHPILIIDSNEYEYNKTKKLYKTNYSISPMKCFGYEFHVQSRARFDPKYTFRQKGVKIVRQICLPIVNIFKKRPHKKSKSAKSKPKKEEVQ